MLAWELKDDVVPEEFIEAGRMTLVLATLWTQGDMYIICIYTRYTYISMLIYSLNIWDNLIWENGIWWMTWTWWWFHPQWFPRISLVMFPKGSIWRISFKLGWFSGPIITIHHDLPGSLESSKGICLKIPLLPVGESLYSLSTSSMISLSLHFLWLSYIQHPWSVNYLHPVQHPACFMHYLVSTVHSHDHSLSTMFHHCPLCIIWYL